MTLSFVSPHIEGLKGSSLAKLQYDLRPQNPIRAFAENQMAYDIERVPSAFSFISIRPGFRQVTQKCIKSSGSVREKRYCVLQVMFHRAPQFPESDFPETLIVVRCRAHQRRRMRPVRPTSHSHFFIFTASTSERLLQLSVIRLGLLHDGAASFNATTIPLRLRRRSPSAHYLLPLACGFPSAIISRYLGSLCNPSNSGLASSSKRG